MHGIQKLLNSYRNEIKGFAILWVVFFHAQLRLEGLLYDIQKIGYGGVDIFFFLAGYGLYHSLSGKKEGYLLRRAQRILPAYLPFCAVWLAVMIPLSQMDARDALRTIAGNVLMLGYFFDTPLMINWYVSALAASLLLAPMVYRCLRGDKAYWLRSVMILTAALVFDVLLVGNPKYMAISRIPVFLLGMITAKPAVPGKDTPLVPSALGIGAAGALTVLMLCFQRRPEWLLQYGMYWHPFILIAPALCAGLGWLFSHLPCKCTAPLRCLGEASFEIFLFNVWAELLGKRYGLGRDWLSWLALSAGSIALGLLWHGILSSLKVLRLFQKKGLTARGKRW